MADLENLLACTVNFFSNFPSPSTLIPSNSFFTSPASFNNAGVTTVPSSNTFKSSTLIIEYSVLNKAFEKPLFGIRRYSGNCPPSNTGLMLPPLRAF